MASRYVTRRQAEGKYCVWDNSIDAVAQTADGQGRYEDLGFDQAVDAAIELNEPDQPMRVPPVSEAPQPVAQQQQQPQPDDTDEKE